MTCISTTQADVEVFGCPLINTFRKACYRRYFFWGAGIIKYTPDTLNNIFRSYRCDYAGKDGNWGFIERVIPGTMYKTKLSCKLFESGDCLLHIPDFCHLVSFYIFYNTSYVVFQFVLLRRPSLFSCLDRFRC